MPTFRVTNEFGHEGFVVADSPAQAAIRAKDFPGEHKKVEKVSDLNQQDLFPARDEGYDPTYRVGS